MGWLIAAIIGLGAIVTAIGNVKEAQSQAEIDEQKAAELEELSKTGGYYDQQLAALQKEFEDIEADRIAAMQVRAIDTLTLAGKGAEEQGRIAAGAGVGGFAQAGSILTRGESIDRQVRRGIARFQIQYEDLLRGTETREAAATAQETFTEYKKTSGLEQAALYREEADWLKTWGVALGIAGPILGGAGDILSLDFSSFNKKEKKEEV